MLVSWLLPLRIGCMLYWGWLFACVRCALLVRESGYDALLVMVWHVFDFVLLGCVCVCASACFVLVSVCVCVVAFVARVVDLCCATDDRYVFHPGHGCELLHLSSFYACSISWCLLLLLLCFCEFGDYALFLLLWIVSAITHCFCSCGLFLLCVSCVCAFVC